MFIVIKVVEFRPSKEKRKWFLKARRLPQFDIAGPAGGVGPFLESPVELRMSSGRRLLIFHASIGTEHVQTAAQFLFFTALVWLHLTFCEIRTRFNSCSAGRRPGESGWKTSHDVSLLYLWELAPIMLPFKCFVAVERPSLFWFASPVGRPKQPGCCFKSHVLTSLSVCGECFQLDTHCLFMEYFLTPTYIIIIRFLVKSPSATTEGACFSNTGPL